MDSKSVGLIALSIAGVVMSIIVGNAWTSTHDSPSKLVVKGHAQTDFTSDLIVWRASFERRAGTIAEAYPLVKDDAEMIKKYLVKKGVKSTEIVLGAVDITKTYRREDLPEGGYRRVFSGYQLRQDVVVESDNVDQVELVAREISELLNAGVELNSRAPEFYYTKLSELKIDMLSRASADGRLRATSIADEGGGSLGALRRADMGTFQITGQNSNEEYTWGGAFNTSSKYKTASITVKMEFDIN